MSYLGLTGTKISNKRMTKIIEIQKCAIDCIYILYLMVKKEIISIFA